MALLSSHWTRVRGYVIFYSTPSLTSVSSCSPYFGQAAWFSVSHPEKLPSAIERYRNETRRVLGVLESVLGTQDWLVGGKLTAADIVFVPYDILLKGHILEDDFEFQKEFPRVFA